MSDDLTPIDGISDYFIEFSGFEKAKGGGVFKFDAFTSKRDDRRYVASLPFYVDSENDGLNGMMVRAHDDLVNALRQMLYAANVQRDMYRQVAEDWVRKT